MSYIISIASDFLYLPKWLIWTQGFILGACIGSFLNVVMYRIPIGPSRRASGEAFNINVPGSHCPICKHSLKWFDNVPIFSWFYLGGRCRHCSTPIPSKYVFFEVSTALLVLFGAFLYGWAGSFSFSLLALWSAPAMKWLVDKTHWTRTMSCWVLLCAGAWLLSLIFLR